MCGIVGIISNKSIGVLEDTVKRMNDLQFHRGPDGEGFWKSDHKNVLFAHRRLSIIDLSEAGTQPMASYDNRYIITFNGEIYNYQALKAKCLEHGSEFHSKTDTEVIMEYIRHFGIDGIKDFRGMWAFALYDTAKNRVILSRDHFGIKPLHYGFKDGNLYFASEIKSLRCVEKHFNEVDQVSEKMFLDSGYLDLRDWTFFKNIRRFPQSCYALIDLNDSEVKLQPIHYWKPSTEVKNISLDDAITKLDLLMNQSIERHMVSDVPIAFCLSGGLDSSTTVGIASKKAVSGQSLNTFTTHYPSFPDIDETKWAKMATEYCNTNSHWIEPTYEEFVKDFKEVLYHHDEPFGSTSIYAQNAIFKAINKAGIKVSLDGQGADEIFAGYHSFYLVYLLCLYNEGRWLTFAREAIYLFIRFPGYTSKIFSDRFVLFCKKLSGKSFVMRALYMPMRFLAKCERLIKTILSYSCRFLKLLCSPNRWINCSKRILNKILPPHSQTNTALDKSEASTLAKVVSDVVDPNCLEERIKFANRALPLHFNEYLICTLMHTSLPQLLRNGDRNSMKSNVESRVPFLDIDLVDFVLSLPDNYKIRKAVTKHILREVSKRYLPSELVDRKDKLGFPSPEKQWLSRAFDIDVSGPFSSEFRHLIVQEWRKMIDAQ
jgi:asparagine synthase (glutamine-hydrolysing)